MPVLKTPPPSPEFRDRYVEATESASLSWEDGVVGLQLGRRAGTGVRWSSRGGEVRFHSHDAPPGEFAPGAIPDAWPGPEVDGALAFLEEAAGAARSAAGDSSLKLSASVQLYRQTMRWEGGGRRAEDQREGARIELRASLRGGRPAARRVAAGTIAALRGRLDARELGRGLGESARHRLGAPWAPRGAMTVIFSGGACGPLVHELGHLFEDEAAGAGPVPPYGTRLAGGGITLVDDPAACAGRGAYAIDDEGNGARAAFLLREGIVAGRIGASLPGPDGHARRGSYRDLPFPRMACTLLAAGGDDPAGIVSGTRDGILVRSLHGGSVDPVTRRIVLLVEEAVRVEGGRETSPVAECLLSVRAEELLGNVDAIGDDLQFDFGAGDCLKACQPLPVRTGMPTIRVRSVPVVAP